MNENFIFSIKGLNLVPLVSAFANPGRNCRKADYQSCIKDFEDEEAMVHVAKLWPCNFSLEV